MKKTIVIFIGGYLPAEQYGGPVTSIANIVENLSDEFNFRIVTSDHDLKSGRPLEGIHEGWNTVKGAQVLYLKEKEFNRRNFEKILGKYSADLIYLSGIFNYRLNLPAYHAARKRKIPILLAPRGELCENALNLKKAKKLLYLSVLKRTGYFKNMRYQATSEEERQAIEDVLNVDEERICLLANLHGEKTAEREEKKEKGKLRILFLARIARKKNLLYAIRVVNQQRGEIVFDIVGPIEEQDYWEECCREIQSAPENIQINYCGAVSPAEAKSVYARYDCFFFPTLSENYGHVIVEAMLAGIPVVISRGTTPWDDVNTKGGYTAELSDPEGFVHVLEDLADMDRKEYQNLLNDLSAYTDAKFNNVDLKERYIQMFNS